MLDKKVHHFFNNIKIRLGFYDWQLKEDAVPTEGMCYHNSKTITIGNKVKDYKYLILHEIAHINTCRFCNNAHNPQFWKEFECLLRKYLKRNLKNKDAKWRDFCLKGFQGYYKKCYQRY